MIIIVPWWRNCFWKEERYSWYERPWELRGSGKLLPNHLSACYVEAAYSEIISETPNEFLDTEMVLFEKHNNNRKGAHGTSDQE